MINSEILMIVDAVSREKNLDKEIIFEAVESALATATRKHHGHGGGDVNDIGVRVAVRRDDGDYSTFRQWEVLADDAEIEFPERQLLLAEARQRKADAEVGEFLEEPLDAVSFGRIATQAAKQTIMQKVREAEREQTVEEFTSRKGTMVSGVVKRLERGDAIVDVGGSEALLHKSVMIPREGLRPGDRVRAILEDVRSMPRGPQLFLNRITPQLLIDLFKIEVPEAGDGLIEIRGAARDPGLRSKIAVHSNDSRIDPVGACVGIRGSRVQSVSNEIAGERVDIIKWSDDLAQFVIQALTPAEAESILVDEETNSVDVVVDEAQLSQAIGRNGQNVRLASELSGWEINIITDEEAAQKSETEQAENCSRLMTLLDIDEDVAGILVQEDYTTLEDLVFSSRQDLLSIEALNEELVDEVRRRAEDGLVGQTVTGEDKGAPGCPSQELLGMDFMDEATAWNLAAKGVTDMGTLGDFALDELIELLPGLDKDRAHTLIMTARAPLFEEQAEQQAEEQAEPQAEQQTESQVERSGQKTLSTGAVK